MPDGGDALTLKVISGLDQVSADQWNACAGPDNPFVSHVFLKTLEDSGAVTSETGWLPQHLILEDGQGQMVGAAPCYVKNHSYGEYVFDWGWADAFERAGGTYYPKLQVAVPFTPVTGPRLLVRADQDGAYTRRILAAGLIELAKQHEVSSVHITFPTQREWEELGDAGLLQRVGQQFHWENRGYETFDNFLDQLSSRKRKNIRKERRDANTGVTIETLTGDAIERRHMEAFYRFYLNTVDRKWAHAYLNRDFFMLLLERMADRIVLVMASNEDRFVGGALNIRGSDTLFGRNWGCIERYRMLYFEACFYRGIDFAIEHGLKRVEAGAQGPHKISRGYLPTQTYSAHWISDENFREAVETFLKREQRMVGAEMDALSRERSPYRKDGSHLERDESAD